MIPDRPALTRHEVMNDLRYGDMLIIAGLDGEHVNSAIIADEHPPYRSPEIIAEFQGYTIDEGGQALNIIDPAGRSRMVLVDRARLWRFVPGSAADRLVAMAHMRTDEARDMLRTAARNQIDDTCAGCGRHAPHDEAHAPGCPALEIGTPHPAIAASLDMGTSVECAGCGRAASQPHVRGCPELAHPPSMRRLTTRTERAPSMDDPVAERILDAAGPRARRMAERIIESRADRAPSAPDEQESTMHDRAERMTRTNGEALLAGQDFPDGDIARSAIARGITEPVTIDEFATDQADLHQLGTMNQTTIDEWLDRLTLDEARAVLERIYTIRQTHLDRANDTHAAEQRIRDRLRSVATLGLEGGSLTPDTPTPNLPR